MERRVLLTGNEMKENSTVMKHTMGGQCTATGVGWEQE